MDDAHDITVHNRTYHTWAIYITYMICKTHKIYLVYEVYITYIACVTYLGYVKYEIPRSSVT